MRWRTVGSTSARLLLAFGQDEETTQYGAGAIGRVLEERGIELEYLIDEGDYRIVSAAEYGAGEGWLMHADLAEKGYADIVLKTKSEGGHSSNPYGGTSLEVLSRAIAAICDIEWPTRVTDLACRTAWSSWDSTRRMRLPPTETSLSATASPAKSSTRS